jgi:hypothetical protein
VQSKKFGRRQRRSDQHRKAVVQIGRDRNQIKTLQWQLKIWQATSLPDYGQSIVEAFPRQPMSPGTLGFKPALVNNSPVRENQEP